MDWRKFSGVCTAFILFVLSTYFFISGFVENASLLLAIGVAMLVILFVKKKPSYDERQVKYKRISTSYSWSITYLIIAVLILINQFQLFKLTVQGVLGIIFFVMITAQLITYFIFNKKGESV